MVLKGRLILNMEHVLNMKHGLPAEKGSMEGTKRGFRDHR